MSHPLRATAESRIHSGTTPPAAAPTLSPEALQLLHRLASAGDNAGDALCLLHELKVYQVELDLQLVQAQENEQEFAQELAVYQDLYQFAPAPYFTVSLDGRIIRANRAGAEIFGVDDAELPGRRIEDVVAAEFRPNLRAMLDDMRNGGCRTVCEVRSNGYIGSSRPLRVVAGPSPGGDSCLMLILDVGHTETPVISG